MLQWLPLLLASPPAPSASRCQDLYIYLGALLVLDDDLPATGHLPLPAGANVSSSFAETGVGFSDPMGAEREETRSVRRRGTSAARSVQGTDSSRDGRRSGPRGSDPIIEVDHVTLRFGGVTSLADVSLRPAARRDPRGHRTERRRQDVAVQLPDRRLRPPRGRHHTSRRRTAEVASIVGKKPHRINHAGGRAHLPDELGSSTPSRPSRT